MKNQLLIVNQEFFNLYIVERCDRCSCDNALQWFMQAMRIRLIKFPRLKDKKASLQGDFHLQPVDSSWTWYISQNIAALLLRIITNRDRSHSVMKSAITRTKCFVLLEILTEIVYNIYYTNRISNSIPPQIYSGKSDIKITNYQYR